MCGSWERLGIGMRKLTEYVDNLCIICGFLNDGVSAADEAGDEGSGLFRK